MCNFVYVLRGGATHECVNHGELSEALGAAPVYHLGADESRSPDECLCHLDARTTADRHGYKLLPQNRFGDITLQRDAA